MLCLSTVDDVTINRHRPWTRTRSLPLLARDVADELPVGTLMRIVDAEAELVDHVHDAVDLAGHGQVSTSWDTVPAARRAGLSTPPPARGSVEARKDEDDVRRSSRCRATAGRGTAPPA